MGIFTLIGVGSGVLVNSSASMTILTIATPVFAFGIGALIISIGALISFE